jgi:hypothetical protein
MPGIKHAWCVHDHRGSADLIKLFDAAGMYQPQQCALIRGLLLPA